MRYANSHDKPQSFGSTHAETSMPFFRIGNMIKISASAHQLMHAAVHYYNPKV
jgi:hypothetical protein